MRGRTTIENSKKKDKGEDAPTLMQPPLNRVRTRRMTMPARSLNSSKNSSTTLQRKYSDTDSFPDSTRINGLANGNLTTSSTDKTRGQSMIENLRYLRQILKIREENNAVNITRNQSMSNEARLNGFGPQNPTDGQLKEMRDQLMRSYFTFIDNGKRIVIEERSFTPLANKTFFFDAEGKIIPPNQKKVKVASANKPKPKPRRSQTESAKGRRTKSTPRKAPGPNDQDLVLTPTAPIEQITPSIPLIDLEEEDNCPTLERELPCSEQSIVDNLEFGVILTEDDSLNTPPVIDNYAELVEVRSEPSGFYAPSADIEMMDQDSAEDENVPLENSEEPIGRRSTRSTGRYSQRKVPYSPKKTFLTPRQIAMENNNNAQLAKKKKEEMERKARKPPITLRSSERIRSYTCTISKKKDVYFNPLSTLPKKFSTKVDCQNKKTDLKSIKTSPMKMKAGRGSKRSLLDKKEKDEVEVSPVEQHAIPEEQPAIIEVELQTSASSVPVPLLPTPETPVVPAPAPVASADVIPKPGQTPIQMPPIRIAPIPEYSTPVTPTSTSSICSTHDQNTMMMNQGFVPQMPLWGYPPSNFNPYQSLGYFNSPPVAQPLPAFPVNDNMSIKDRTLANFGLMASQITTMFTNINSVLLERLNQLDQQPSSNTVSTQTFENSDEENGDGNSKVDRN